MPKLPASRVAVKPVHDNNMGMSTCLFKPMGPEDLPGGPGEEGGDGFDISLWDGDWCVAVAASWIWRQDVMKL